MVHKPKHKVHSFRGLLGDGGQDEINLERQNANLAYRIVKFQVMTSTPGGVTYEHIVKVYKEEQSSVTAVIDFSQPDLLAVGYITQNDTMRGGYNQYIFDNVLFSRNIYVTQADEAGSSAANYYLELEEVPVNAATLMQLKLGVARKLNLTQ